MATSESDRAVWLTIGAISLIAAAAVAYLFLAGAGEGLVGERADTAGGAAQLAGQELEHAAHEAGAAIERAGERAREDSGQIPAGEK